MTGQRNNSIGKVGIIGNYLPRQCGIAAFTTDLCEGLAAQYPETTVFAVPVNDTEAGYAYPARVRFELAERDIISYRRAADFLNIGNVDLICLQHEYGIFGGPAGSHILALLRELRMPVVTTLHTVLREPEPDQREVLRELAQLSDRLIVMSNLAAHFLRDISRVPGDRIDVIPHGIPDVPFVDSNVFKDQFGVADKLVLLTFGLLSPHKGIEHVINALPGILARRRDVVYMVVGATHPHLRRREGEAYRLRLERLAHARGVEGSVIFHDRFVSLDELSEFIGAADIYLTPYLDKEQIVSGTLAYAVGAGKAVVSTPYWYAEELLAERRGVLVPFGDTRAIAARVLDLLENDAERHAIRKRAYLLGREMTWPRVAMRYMESFLRCREERMRHSQATFKARTLDRRRLELPIVNLGHLHRMTDDTGVLQHAIFTVPNYTEGYATDDNARALMLSVLLEEINIDTAEVEALVSRYLAFLWSALNTSCGRFRNFLSYDRRWLEEVGSEDSHGRALWGLGVVVGRSSNRGFRSLAGRLFDLALPAALQFTSPRASAFAIIGIHEYLKQFSGDGAARNADEVLGERLLDMYHQHGSRAWPWFEDVIAYCNASLPRALLLCGERLRRHDMIEAALTALDWLCDLQRSEQGHFVPIGSNGFYVHGGKRARFDQQPVEACDTVGACLTAFHVTGDPRWRDEAKRAFEWFLGRNDLSLPLYDPATGGCRDGLHVDRVNENQGAESTLALLLSTVDMRLSDTPRAAAGPEPLVHHAES